MKTFKQHITEVSSHRTQIAPQGSDKTAAAVGSSGEQGAEDSVIGAHNIHDEKVLDVVNGFVGSIADGEYINPQHAVDKLAEKLARVGLHFECPPLKGDEGKITCEVMKHGGRFGKDTDTKPEDVINDDGISHLKDGGLKMSIEHMRNHNNTYKVYAKLI